MIAIRRLSQYAPALLAAVVTLSALCGGGPAQAADVSSLIITGLNFASDENREYLIDRVITVPGQIDVGDSLRGSFNINTLNSAGANVGGTTPNNEWTGVFQFVVTDKIPLPGGFFLFKFAPDPAFASSLCGGVASCIATQPAMAAIVPGTGAMIVMFEDPFKNFAADFDDTAAGPLALLPDDGTPHVAPHGGSGPPHTAPPSSDDVSSGLYVTEEAFIARAADGTRFWTIGFTNGVPDGPGSAVPGPGEGFAAVTVGPNDNILTAFTVTSGTGFVLNNAGLNRIGNAVPETGDAIPLGVVTTVFAAAGGGDLCSPPAIPCGTAQFAFTGLTRGVFDLDTPFEASSDLNAVFNVVEQAPPIACRVTGGGNDEFVAANGTNRYTFGGQAGANTALPPQPQGNWEHNNHSGPAGRFAFHVATILTIQCNDPGFCKPARAAPAKQIDFTGIGRFNNLDTDDPNLSSNVVVKESQHFTEVSIDDAGEPGNTNPKKNPSLSCPVTGFDPDDSVDCGCGDFYRIRIHRTEDPASAVIYEVFGYIDGGNFQIHPPTGFDRKQ